MFSLFRKQNKKVAAPSTSPVALSDSTCSCPVSASEAKALYNKAKSAESERLAARTATYEAKIFDHIQNNATYGLNFVYCERWFSPSVEFTSKLLACGYTVEFAEAVNKWRIGW